MNYKKSIAFILALSMCVPVVASNISLVSDNVGVYADSTENDSSISYENVYTYNTELETTLDDVSGKYNVDVSKADNVRIIISNCTGYIGFNINNDTGYLGYFGGNPDSDGNVIIDIDVDNSLSLILDTSVEGLKVYAGELTGIKTIKTLSSTDTLDTTGYTSMIANYVYNGTLENGLWYGLNLVDSEDEENILAESGVWFNSGENSTGYATFDVTGIDKIINIVNNADTTYDENVTLTSVQLSSVDDIATFSNIDIFTKESSKVLDLTSVKSIAIKDGADAEVVTIDNNIITGSKVGETTLVVTYVDDSTAEITVNVKTLAFSNATKSVNKDENSTIDLTSEVLSGTPISWTSSDTDVATINETTGVLTPIADGTTTITIVDKFGNEATMEVKITSKEVVQVDKTSVELETTDTHQITITNSVNPKGYASSDENVATVTKTL